MWLNMIKLAVIFGGKSTENEVSKMSAKSVLNNLDKNWRKCDFVKKLNFCSRIIKTNKILLIIYCWISSYKYAK